MKKDRLKDLESRYWEGKSSLEDEQHLKDAKDNSYFEGLSAAKKEQMDWSFDHFVQQTETEKIAPTRITTSVWGYIGIAAALFIAGFLFLKDRRPTPDTENIYLAQVREHQKPLHLPAETERIVATPEEEDIFPVAKTKERQESKRKEPAQRVVAPAEEVYVLVNGEPVYDEQEAQQIVMASLQLMANNLQEGREAVEKIKYMKIEL